MEWTIEQPQTLEAARLSAGRYVAAAGWTLLVAVVALAWGGHGEQVLVGAAGSSAVVQGSALLRLARAGRPLRAPGLAAGSVLGGLAAVFVALLSGTVSGGLLLLGVLAAALAPAARAARAGLPAGRGTASGLVRPGLAVLVPVLVLAGLLLLGIDATARVATVLLALALAGAAVALLVQARRFSAQARLPAAAGCAGCAGGCQALPRA